MRITLRGATAALLSAAPPTVALSLASGELYLARLRVDGRGVRSIDPLKVVLSVPACAACALGTKYLFLGSQVADSLLLQLYDPHTAARRGAASLALRGKTHDAGAAMPLLFAPKKPVPALANGMAGDVVMEASADGEGGGAAEAEEGHAPKRLKTETPADGAAAVEAAPGAAEEASVVALRSTASAEALDALEADAAGWEEEAEAREAEEAREEIRLYASGFLRLPAPPNSAGCVTSLFALPVILSLQTP